MTTRVSPPLIRPGSKSLAIVAAVNTYKPESGIPALKGARNDAKAFVRWLKSPSGGNLRADEIKVFREDDVNANRAPTRPMIANYVKAVVHELDDLRIATGEQTPIDRLYLYFVGHGYRPVNQYGGRQNDAAWLGSNYDHRNQNDHVCGASLAEELKATGLFHEIVVAMDCCRGSDKPPHISPFSLQVKHQPPRIPGYVVMFACEPDRLAYEQRVPGGRSTRGVFSLALWEALMYKRVTGQLRIPDIFDYLDIRMLNLRRRNPAKQTADLISYGAQAGRIVIAQGAPGGPFPVEIVIKSSVAGVNHSVQNAKGTQLALLTPGERTKSLALDIGVYQVARDDRADFVEFEVFPAMDPVEVSFA